jgi:DNA-binding NtrC family response regulator
MIGRLRAGGMSVSWASDGEEALQALEAAHLDALVAPLAAPGIDGLAVLRRARARHPALCAVLTAGAAGTRRAAEALREGAWDVLDRRADPDRVRMALERGLSHQRSRARLAELERAQADAAGPGPFDGRSRAITGVMEQVRHLASTHVALLIEGEAGTGKGLAAWAIHLHSPRRSRPFVTLDCTGLDARTIERELFGVAEPAPDARPGRLEESEGGTLFLDEIGAAPPGVQVQLLRLLQDRSFERAGGRTTIRADVRLVAATRVDLAAEVRAGRFREDLYRRLGAVRVVMPALRERREDIPLLVERFVRDSNRRHRRRVRGVTPGVLEHLVRHDWPGNVRELRDTIERMVIFAPGGRPLDLADLPEPLQARGGEPRRIAIAPGMTVNEAVRLLIAATLAHTGNDKPRAAAMLGIGLRTLYRKIREHGMR